MDSGRDVFGDPSLDTLADSPMDTTLDTGGCTCSGGIPSCATEVGCNVVCDSPEGSCVPFFPTNYVRDGEPAMAMLMPQSSKDIVISQDTTWNTIECHSFEVNGSTLDTQILQGRAIPGLMMSDGQSWVSPEVCVVFVNSLVMEEGTLLTVIGSRALMILANDRLQVSSILARGGGTTSGPGGYSGAMVAGQRGDGPFGGPGGEVFHDGDSVIAASGGAGASFGTQGGQGGNGWPAIGESPITTDMPLSPYAGRLQPLFGGSGGGAGRDDRSHFSSGGGGGGAIQLVALREVVINGRVSVSGGEATGRPGSGGGGGSGGAVFVECPGAIIMNGFIDAAGGGAQSGSDTSDRRINEARYSRADRNMDCELPLDGDPRELSNLCPRGAFARNSDHIDEVAFGGSGAATTEASDGYGALAWGGGGGSGAGILLLSSPNVTRGPTSRLWGHCAVNSCASEVFPN